MGMAINNMGLIFDLFDTLVGIDLPAFRAGREQAAQAMGVAPDKLQQAWKNFQDERTLGRIKSLEEMYFKAALWLNRPINSELARQLADWEEQNLLGNVSLYEDVLPILDAFLTRKMPLALLSNASAWADSVFSTLGLERWFPVRVWSWAVGMAKPDPGIYLAASTQLGRSPEECVFVGDGASNELQGARMAGMRAVRINRNQQNGPTNPNWDGPEVSSLRQLAELLGFADEPLLMQISQGGKVG